MPDEDKVHRITTAGEKQPWWNDGDKVGGLGATIMLLGLACILLAILVAISYWILRICTPIF